MKKKSWVIPWNASIYIDFTFAVAAAVAAAAAAGM